MRLSLRGSMALLAAFLMAIMVLPAARPAHATAVWYVSDTNDETNPGCGPNNSGYTVCSLRDIINQSAAGDIVYFQPIIGTDLNSPLPTINKSLTIDTQGQTIRLDGRSLYSIFTVSGSGITVTINGLTLQNANASTNSNAGGALFVGGSSTVNLNNDIFTGDVANNTGLGGGAIEVDGNGSTVNVYGSTFSGNSTSGIYVSGGAIDDESQATVNIASSTFVGNSVTGTGFAGGGALYAGFGGSLNVANSTFFNNHLSGPGLGGGAIELNSGAVALGVTNSTFVGDTENGGPIGVLSGNNTATTIVRNSIFSGEGCYLPGVIAANNLASDTSCGPTLGAVTHLDSAPGNHGGTIETIALLPGSNAIDGVAASQCYYPGGFPNISIFNTGAYSTIIHDARGTARASASSGPRCDIGAYEVQSGNPASLTINGFPGSIAAGTPGTVRVTALDSLGYTAYSYTGTVHLSSSDTSSSTVLPGNYTFQGGDYGSAAFNATLTTAGSQSITAADTANGAFTATQSGIVVSPATPTRLVFIGQPTNTLINKAITPALTVAEQDSYNNLIASDNTSQVALALSSNPSTSDLLGTSTGTLSNGTVTFNGIKLDKAGVGYKLLAYSSTTPLIAALSSPFTISIPPNIDTVGVYRSGTFLLRLSNSAGTADLTIGFNPPGTNLPIVGDWTGQGYDAVGVYNQATGFFTLCTQNTTALCASTANQISVLLGNPQDTPLSGRWTSAATHAGVGVFRPTNGILYMKSALTSGVSDYADVLGNPGDVGIASDWTGKGYDSPGVYRATNTTFYLTNSVTNGIVYGDQSLQYGTAGDAPIAGDWVSQGHDGVGMFHAAAGSFYLRNTLTTGTADNTFTFGTTGDLPVAGHWQVTYPGAPGHAPTAPPILIAKTATPVPTVAPTAAPSSGSVPGGNQIGG